MIHTLDQAAELVDLTYSRNPNARPSATFRKLRRMRQCSCFGDYPLLVTLFGKMREKNIDYNRGQVRRALAQSEELQSLTRREKRRMMEALENNA